MTINYVRGSEHPLAKHGIDGCYEVNENGCWIWQGAQNRGYGLVRRAGRGWYAHRYSWTLVNGEIPGDLTIDHLCFTPLCVNPDHLRLLTRSENSINQRPRRKTHCKQGHEFTPENTALRYEKGKTGPAQRCRECDRIYDRRRYAEKRDAEIEARVAELQAARP